MRVTIITAGSRGDVQPFVALGQGLRNNGHQVSVCTHASFEEFVTQYGLEYRFMNDDMVRFLLSNQGHEMIASADGAFGWLKSTIKVNKQFKPIMRRMLDEEWAASRDADLIIYHPKAVGGYDIAEKRGIPLIISLPLPLMTPTRAFPCILFSRVKLGGWFNRLSYSFLRYAAAMYSGLINRWRKDTLSLPPRRVTTGTRTRGNGESVPVLYSYSPHVLPRPADWPATDLVTGYWFLDRKKDSWEPSKELKRFLAAGPPPVYVGFGSIAGKDPAKTGATVLEALRLSGQRGILASGWGGIATSHLPDTVMKIGQVPHDWLLPQVASVVHHGGAGTTAAGLRAGKPTVVCPFFGDQPFWGERMVALGVGPDPIPQKTLTEQKLGDAIRITVTDREMQCRAARIGQEIRAEDGVKNAVRFAEVFAKTWS
jgi:sterol 3beta-glucosyltransferase